jgi:hypothetical protein
MPTADEITLEWIVDCEIDKLDLDESSRKTPSIHSKYLRYYILERRNLRLLEAKLTKLKNNKRSWFNGEMDFETLKELKWSPNPAKRPLKSTLEDELIPNCPDVILATEEYGEQRDKVEGLSYILKEIAQRNYHIKNSISVRRLEAGLNN